MRCPKNVECYNSKNYTQYFIKTVRTIPGKPRERRRTIVQSSKEKYFSTNFNYFDAKCSKNDLYYNSENYYQYVMKNIRDNQKGPASVRELAYNPMVKNKSRPNFIISARNNFHIFGTSPRLLDTVTTATAHTLHNPITFYRKPTKNNYIQDKFATPENKPNINRKIMFGSEILAVQTNLTAHPYYSINLCRRQKSFTSHFTEPF